MCTSEDELIAAIARAPDDDGPRLVYADWLQQRGEPRGEWISIQCALARAPGDAALSARQAELAREHQERWLGELGLQRGEGEFVRGFVEKFGVSAERACELEPLWRSPVRDIVVRVDFGGNDEEIVRISEALARELPPAFRSFVVDRSARWDLAHDTRVELAGEALRVELGTADGPRPELAVVAATLARAPHVSALEIGLWPRGRVEIDDIIDALPESEVMRSVGVRFYDLSGRDWMRWIASRRIAELAARYPGLERLSVPMGELWLEALDHRALRELELHWLGMVPLGPADPDGHGPPARGSGLEFLRGSQLPSLERLAIDFQFSWYVPWTSDDFVALCEARLPRLGRLELRYAGDGDELCRHLVKASFAGQLLHLELTGTEISEAGARWLLEHRGAFPRLERLVWLQPLDLADDWWHALERAYPIELAP